MAQLDCFHYSCVLQYYYIYTTPTIYYILQTRFASTLQLLRETQRSHIKVQGCNYDRSGKPFTSSLKSKGKYLFRFRFQLEKKFLCFDKMIGSIVLTSAIVVKCVTICRGHQFILRLFGSQIAVCSKASAEYVI